MYTPAGTADFVPLGRDRLRNLPAAPARFLNGFLFLLAFSLFLVVLLAVNLNVAHWFLFPVFVCGMLTGPDVVAWLRRELDVFDAKAIVGILWLHNTCLAPLLHTAWDFHTPLFDAQVQDWRAAFGLIACVNAIALIFYKAGHRWFFGRTAPTRSIRLLQPGRFGAVLSVALLASFAATIFILFQYGGLRKDEAVLGTEAVHLSWLLMLGDPFLVLLMLAAIRVLSSPGMRVRSILVICGLLVVLLVGQWFLLGMRGSRSAVIMALILGAGFCHFRLRPIPLSLVLAGLVAFSIGGYYYAFYKRFGATGLEAIRDPQYIQTLAHRSGITPMGSLLGDLSRAEVQAYILYELMNEGNDYSLRLGRTYLAAAMTVIPRAMWPNKPSDYFGKVAAGTDLQFGAGSFRPNRFKSSRVYGLGGEAMLNFGAVGVPFFYLLFGMALGWFRRKAATLHPADARLYLVPLGILMFFTAAFGDSDNAVFLFLKNGFLLVAVIYLGSVQVKQADSLRAELRA